MNHLKIILMMLFIIPNATIYAQSVDDLILMSEQFPPFNFEENGELKGTSIDLMALILERMNSKLTRNDIQILPWGRSYRDLQEVENTVLFVVTRTKTREKLFKWVGPISSAKNVLIAQKDKKITINSIDDAKKYAIGAVSNDAGLQLLLEAGIEQEQIEDVPYPVLNIRKMEMARIELFAYDEGVAKWLMRKEGLNPEKYESVYLLEEGQHYFAFHVETSEILISKFQQVLDEIKAEGIHDKILNKYLK